MFAAAYSEIIRSSDENIFLICVVECPSRIDRCWQCVIYSGCTVIRCSKIKFSRKCSIIFYFIILIIISKVRRDVWDRVDIAAVNANDPPNSAWMLGRSTAPSPCLGSPIPVEWFTWGVLVGVGSGVDLRLQYASDAVIQQVQVQRIWWPNCFWPEHSHVELTSGVEKGSIDGRCPQNTWQTAKASFNNGLIQICLPTSGISRSVTYRTCCSCGSLEHLRWRVFRLKKSWILFLQS